MDFIFNKKDKGTDNYIKYCSVQQHGNIPEMVKRTRELNPFDEPFLRECKYLIYGNLCVIVNSARP